MDRTRPYRVVVAVAVWGPIDGRPGGYDDEILKTTTVIRVASLADARQAAGEVLARLEEHRPDELVTW